MNRLALCASTTRDVTHQTSIGCLITMGCVRLEIDPVPHDFLRVTGRGRITTHGFLMASFDHTGPPTYQNQIAAGACSAAAGTPLPLRFLA